MTDDETLPPGLRVMIGGSLRDRGGRSAEFVELLTRSLLEKRTDAPKREPQKVIVTGGRRKKVDGLVAKTVKKWCRENDVTLSERLVTYSDSETLERGFKGSFHHPYDSRYVRRIRMVEELDAIVLVGGKSGVRQLYLAAKALKKPVLTIPIAGGRAEELWTKSRSDVEKQLRRRASSVEVPEWQTPADDMSEKELRTAVDEARRLVEALAEMRCFVAMACDDRAARRVLKVVKKAGKKLAFKVVSECDHPGHGSIKDGIESRIRKSTVLFAVLPDPRYSYREDDDEMNSANPNVLWEAGFAEALGIPTYYVSTADTKLPFDIADQRHLTWTGEKAELKRDVIDALEFCRGKRPEDAPSTETTTARLDGAGPR